MQREVLEKRGHEVNPGIQKFGGGLRAKRGSRLRIEAATRGKGNDSGASDLFRTREAYEESEMSSSTAQIEGYRKMGRRGGRAARPERKGSI